MGFFDFSGGGNMGFASVKNIRSFTNEELFEKLSAVKVSFGVPVEGDISGTYSIMYKNVTDCYDVFVRVHKEKIIMGKLGTDGVSSVNTALRTEAELIGGAKDEGSSVADRAVDELLGVIKKLENGETVTITDEAMPAATSTGEPIVFFMVEKALAIKPKFDVFDSNNEAVYHVEGNITEHNFSICRNGKEVVKLKRKFLTVMDEYYIEQEGIEVARIKKKFKLINPELNGTVCGEPLKISGDIMGYDYNISIGSKVVCHVDKASIWTDRYRISIMDEKMQDILIALAIICDRAADSEEQHR